MLVTRVDKVSLDSGYTDFRFWLENGMYISPSDVLRPVEGSSGQTKFVYAIYGKYDLKYYLPRNIYNRYKALGGCLKPEFSEIIVD